MSIVIRLSPSGDGGVIRITGWKSRWKSALGKASPFFPQALQKLSAVIHLSRSRGDGQRQFRENQKFLNVDGDDKRDGNIQSFSNVCDLLCFPASALVFMTCDRSTDWPVARLRRLLFDLIGYFSARVVSESSPALSLRFAMIIIMDAAAVVFVLVSIILGKEE